MILAVCWNWNWTGEVRHSGSWRSAGWPAKALTTWAFARARSSCGHPYWSAIDFYLYMLRRAAATAAGVESEGQVCGRHATVWISLVRIEHWSIFNVPCRQLWKMSRLNVKTRENEFESKREYRERCVVCAVINPGGPMFSKLSAELHHGDIEAGPRINSKHCRDGQTQCGRSHSHF